MMGVLSSVATRLRLGRPGAGFSVPGTGHFFVALILAP